MLARLTLKQKAVLALIVANTIWGAASPIFKWALENIPLFTLAYFRFFIACLLVFPLAINKNSHLQRSDILSLITLALLGITINITFFFLGLKHAPSINAPIIASAGPVFLILASMLFLKEHPRSKTVTGTLISLVGVFIIISRPLIESGFDYGAFAGNLYFVLATLGAVGHAVISKKLLARYDALELTFWSFLIGAVSFFPFFVYETLHVNWLVTLDIRGITGLVFGILFSSTIAYFLYSWAIKVLPASEIGVFTYIDPVIATVIAIPLLGEVITPLFILGSFFVFAGIVVAEGRLQYHPLHKLKTT
ncbi:DMT family transporter [Candidatus Gottesmanbacteria bacterium]|nr:DMT family transporter [Candidatus Gottesmanbacteria bacterium]